MAQLDPYALDKEVVKLANSGQPGAKAAILQLLKAHGYDEDSWVKMKERIRTADDKGVLGKAWEHHLIQTEHGNRARGVSGQDTVLGRVTDQLRVFNDAASFGLADPIKANTIGLFDPNMTTKGERQLTQQARNRLTPFERVGTNVAGALAGPAVQASGGLTAVQQAIAQGKGLGKRVLEGMKEGAKYGTIDTAGHQVGNTELSLPQQVGQNIVGAVGGAVGGGAIPVAGAAAGWLKNKIPGLRDLGEQGLNKAQQIVLKALRDDAEARANMRGLPQPDAAGAVTQARTRVADAGPETMLADTGPAALATTQGAISKPGPGASSTQMTISERAAGEEGRMQALAQDVLPPTGQGTLIPSQGNVKVQGEPTQSAESIIREQRNALQPRYTQVLNDPNIQPIDQAQVATIVQRIDNELATLPGDSPHRAALERVRGNLVAQPANPGSPAVPGNAYTLPTPAVPATPEVYVTDPNILHNLKGELQGRVNWEGGATTGSARKVEGANKVVSGAIDDVLDTAVPGYSQINQQYRDLTTRIDDIGTGQRVLDRGTTTQEVTNAMDRSQGSVMSGAMEAINNLLNNSKGNTFTQLRGMFNDRAPGLADKMRMIMGDDAYARFMTELRNEQARKNTAQAVAGNPPTAQRIGAKEAMDEVANVPARASAESWVAQIMAMGVKAIDAFRSQQVRDEVARLTGLQGEALDRALGDIIAGVSVQQQKAAGDAGRSGATGALTTQGLLGTPGISGIPEQVQGLTIDMRKEPQPVP